MGNHGGGGGGGGYPQNAGILIVLVDVCIGCSNFALDTTHEGLRAGVNSFLPLSPPGWRGIVVTVGVGGRAAGRVAAKLAEPVSL